MDNQHKHIKGYRDLNAEEVQLMNDIKAHAEETRELLKRVDEYVDGQSLSPENPHTIVTDPSRWVSLARTDLQTGFMCLTRAVAQPTTF